MQLRTVLSEWVIDAEHDPFCAGGGGMATGGDDTDDDEEDAVPLTEKERCHIENMIKGYVADEEDADLLALLQREFDDLRRLHGAAGALSSSATASLHKKQAVASKAQAVGDDDSDGDADAAADCSADRNSGAGSGNSSSSESRFARSGRRCRVESHFQHLISAAPAQVVRFDY